MLCVFCVSWRPQQFAAKRHRMHKSGSRDRCGRSFPAYRFLRVDPAELHQNRLQLSIVFVFGELLFLIAQLFQGELEFVASGAGIG